MMKSLCLLLMVFTSANTVESKLFELFVKDVIDEWKLNTPTIIVDNDIPDTCKTLSWSLCLANELSVQELVLHLQTFEETSSNEKRTLFFNITLP